MGFYPVTIAILLLCAGHFLKPTGLANRGAEFWQRLKGELGEQRQLDDELPTAELQAVPTLNGQPYGSNHQPENIEPEQPPYLLSHENADLNDDSLEATPAEGTRVSATPTLTIYIPRSSMRPVGPGDRICVRHN